MENIRKVHVVFKTHLDIGFTDLAETVLGRYLNQYIPNALKLAEEMNQGGKKRFIWTVGSFLIDYYLRNAGETECRNMVQAIENGDVAWHGLACTTHTELLDRELLEFDLSVSDRLDERFHRNTIAAKMTDVPGHTRSMVSSLAEHGKTYLHIGVNPSSMVPKVPATFVWKSGQSELVVQYSSEYGAPCYVEGMDELLEFAHTGDNIGPQSSAVIEKELTRIAQKYPGAEIVSSTLDAYAKSLMKYKDQLPVIEEEIGDTWIHGVASDPLKVSRYRTLIQLKNQWRKEGRFGEKLPGYFDFMMNLLLIAEHTWGLDFKKYLADFTNWEKADFQKARKEDTTTLDFLTNRNANMLSVLKEDIRNYRGGKFSGSYRFYESSYTEQMNYVWNAVHALPEDLQQEAMVAMEGPECRMPEEAQALIPGVHVQIGSWEVAFGGDGEITFLSQKGQKWVHSNSIGHLLYATYDARDCYENYYSYNRNFRGSESWSGGDFGKPGLEYVEDLEHREYAFGVRSMQMQGTTVWINLQGNSEAVRKYGCPKTAEICYRFKDQITVQLSWKEKDANKMPEALWFDMKFDVENPYRWNMIKIGEVVAPMDVLKGGNRRHHCVEAMSYSGADGQITVRNIHAPLVSVGGHWMYGDYRIPADIREGFSYCLFNK